MESSPLSSRPLSLEDFEQWHLLWDGYNRFYGRAELPKEITKMTWSRLFDAYEPIHGLVAERQGLLLGMAHYLFIAAPF